MEDKLTLKINSNMHGKTALVTGAGGTIGSAVVGSLLEQGVNVVPVDISEYSIYRLNEKFDVRGIVGDVSNLSLVNMIFAKHHIDYIFHCAAYKHVDISEEDINTYSAFMNNVDSTACLLKFPVERFILISSDKAVNPQNTIGRSKLASEQLVKTLCTGIYKIVRFGNVYNSSGSFVETLNRQIETNQPVTITDKRMRRSFLTINDAVSLINEVTHIDDQSGTYMLDMGEEVNILDLVPKDYPIKYVGIRAGEKLTEDLLGENEVLVDTSNELIKCIITKTF